MLQLRLPAMAVLLSLTFAAPAATYSVTSGADSGPGTLRQAILDANANAGLDAIRFAVAAIDTIASDLPPITGPVDIQGPVRVALATLDTPYRLFHFAVGSNGSVLRDIEFGPWSIALEIDAGVSGIVVERTTLVVGYQFIRGDANTFADSTFFELTISGNANQILRNRGNIMKIEAGDGNQVGSSGNGNRFLHLFISSASNTAVEANTFPGDRVGAGLSVTGPAPGTRISGNSITDYPLPGILIDSNSEGVTITGNSIHDTNIPIDLGFDGPTANDPAPDADAGANNRQNYPVLTSAAIANGTLTVTGALTSAPSTTYLVELFADREADAEARTLLASFDVTTDPAGVATFTRNITSPLPGGNDAVTSTATNRTTGDTSEVSAALAVDAPGQLAFSSAIYPANESAGSVTITVNRAGGADGTVTVQYATANGSAVAPADYTTTSGTLTFAPGVTSQTFAVPIVADEVREPEEAFTVTLSGPTGGATLGNAAATVTIEGHLMPGQLAFSSPTYSFNEAEGTATITVNRTGGADGTVAVQYATQNGTAMAPADYTTTSGTLTFAPGVTSQTFVVPIVGDAVREPEENFTVTLSGPTGGATLGNAAATVTIEGHLMPGQLAFSSPTYSINEAEGTATITVNRTGGSDETVTVQYATQNGTANAPGDYTTTSGTLTFAPGVTTQSFAVPIVIDAVPEPEESFTVVLSNATGGATLGAATATIVIAAHLPGQAIPTASTWALIILAAALAAITLSRIGR